MSQYFSDTLAQIAMKGLLKKTLFDKVPISARYHLSDSTDFPLIASPDNSASLVYRSAIALKLAASKSTDANTIAKQLIEAIATVHHQSLEISEAASLTKAWTLANDDQGWIIIALSDSSVTAWLDRLDGIDLLQPSLDLSDQRQSRQACTSTHNQSPHNQSTNDGSTTGRYALCTKLRLSLSALLQFGYNCCSTWSNILRAHMTNSPAGQTTCQTGDNAQDKMLRLQLQWSSQSPIACHKLLQAIATALDTMGEQKGDRVTCLCQSYYLTEAVYIFQATLSLTTLLSLPLTSQASAWSVLRAAQQVLGLVIVNVLGGDLERDFERNIGF